MSTIPYRLAVPHTTLRYTFAASCTIDLALVQPWDQYTRAQQDEFFQHGHIPCDGGFIPGRWCWACRFGTVTPETREDYR